MIYEESPLLVQTSPSNNIETIPQSVLSKQNNKPSETYKVCASIIHKKLSKAENLQIYSKNESILMVNEIRAPLPPLIPQAEKH